MAKASMHVAYYFFLLTFCIDEGDGRWKKTDTEILQRDIKLFRKIAERVEHELKEYYDEYSDEDLQQFYTDRNTVQNYFVPHDTKEVSTKKNEPNKKAEIPLFRESYSTHKIPVNNKLIQYYQIQNDSILSDKTVSNNAMEKLRRPPGKWPKFEDMLQAMGKKYDWKNDRWIKVKVKVKEKYKENEIGKLDNSVTFHEKHRFSYRSIKLSRGKNKRNVVIAVTAIR